MQFRYRGIERLATGIDDYGPLRVQLLQIQAYRFADTPLDAIAHHCFADRARHGEANMRTCRFGFPDAESREQRTRDAGTVVVNPSEVLRSKQADTFRKPWDGYYLSSLTVSFLRPAARRRERTARPFLVSMRERKPWVFARWRLFG